MMPKTLEDLCSEREERRGQLEELQIDRDEAEELVVDLDRQIERVEERLRELGVSITEAPGRIRDNVRAAIASLRLTAHSTFDGIPGPEAVEGLCDVLLKATWRE